jgi:hypothetical protein
MKKTTMIVIAAIGLMACKNNKKDVVAADSSSTQPMDTTAVLKMDTIFYKYDSVKVYSKTPVSPNKDITDTAKATVIFPVFKSETINSEVKKIALVTDSPDDPIFKSYKELTTNFINGFERFKSEMKDNQHTWFKHIKITVLTQRDHYLGFSYDFMEYNGGAHGGYSKVFLNYNPVSKNVITLDTLLKPNAKFKLNAIAEEIFRKNEGLSATESLKGAYFFDKDVFALNNNFTITDKGLNFLYNPYEIKPYAAGITELFIPFENIKDLLKPNPVLPALK